MNLKVYRSIIFTLIILALGVTITSFAFMVIDFNTHGVETMDALIFIICYILLAVFIIAQFGNTIVSLKEGSSFVKNLTYDDIKKQWNKRFLIITGFVMALAIACLVYFIVLIFNPTLIFGNAPYALKLMIISICVLIIFDGICLELFPLTGQQDKAFRLKK